jgi:dUTP pyrophosphatase
MKIKMIKFNNYTEPLRKHYNDAGLDVCATETVALWPHESKAIGVGFGICLPDGYAGFICPRSGLSSKGITCNLAAIDSGYTGEIHALVTNTTNEKIIFNKGDRIGQLIIVPIIIPEFVEDLGEQRGANGLGSSGK